MGSVPTWVESYGGLCAKYGGGLAMMGLDGVGIAVYTYLFYRRATGDGDPISAPGIVGKIAPVSAHLPKEYRMPYTEKTVRTALAKLVELGLAESVEAPKKTRAAGRPAALAYKAAALSEATARISGVLDGYKNAILGALGTFEQIEEGVALGAQGRGGARQ